MSVQRRDEVEGGQRSVLQIAFPKDSLVAIWHIRVEKLRLRTSSLGQAKGGCKPVSQSVEEM
jgi:hypothetical protein